MKRLQPAELPHIPVRQFIRDAMASGVTRRAAKDAYRDIRADKVFMNDVYQVNVREIEEGFTHLSIKRIDKAPCRDWRDFQQIKNEICGAEREGVELYPAESRVVDGANQYHLWVLPLGLTMPLGFHQGRQVTDEPGIPGAVQRPREETT